MKNWLLKAVAQENQHLSELTERKNNSTEIIIFYIASPLLNHMLPIENSLHTLSKSNNLLNLHTIEQSRHSGTESAARPSI